jgi:hypothetical protein
MDSFWIYGMEELFGKLVSSDKGLPENEAYVRLQRQRNKLKFKNPLSKILSCSYPNIEIHLFYCWYLL